VPVLVLAAAAFAGGAIVAAGRGSDERDVVRRFAEAWERGDFGAMHAELTRAAGRRVSARSFARRYRAAAATATATAVRAGEPGRPRNGIVSLPVTVSTRVFGTIRATLQVPVRTEDERPRIAWAQRLTIPGLRDGERLTRRTNLPRRADLLARDGTPLAQGEGRTSTLASASAIAGSLGPIPKDRAEELRAQGVPDDAQVGTSGLERVFDERLRGTPGGVLRAGGRDLAAGIAMPAPAVRTSIAPSVQTAAVDALGGRLGGIAAVRPRTGEILALSGIAFSGLQPPGSTFKIVTLAAALDAGAAGPNSSYPVQTSTTLDGVELQNANGESCGGTLTNAFAHSCNSVFAPLAVKTGARHLVSMAERLGFNRSTGIPGAATSTIPPAKELGDDLTLGSTGIGQGRLQATALQMSWIASTIAMRGRRPRLSLDASPDGQRTDRVMRQSTAGQVAKMMAAVVASGTGGAAAIDGVRVAGKTGTAELRSTQRPECEITPPDEGEPEPPPRPDDCPDPDDPSDTDAWFSAFAPASEPRVAVGVLVVGAGAGGDSAAPAAKVVMQAALKR
jgi:cell division protein FtsI/penicillin-binding protein 2